MYEENKIAYVITEITQGEGGVNVATRKIIKNVYDTTRKYHPLLITDEVHTGIGSTARWWTSDMTIDPKTIEIIRNQRYPKHTEKIGD